MKRLIGLVILIAVLVFPIISQAEESVVYGLLNANGAVYYIPDNKVVVASAGIEVAKFYDLVGLRAEIGTAMVKESDVTDTYIGIGFAISIPNLLGFAGGAWVRDKLNPSLNVAYLGDIDNMLKNDELDFNYAVGVNFVNYNF